MPQHAAWTGNVMVCARGLSMENYLTSAHTWSGSQKSQQYGNPGLSFMETALYQMPAAYADLTGNPGTGNITGIVRFYPIGNGLLVNAEAYGLPTQGKDCGNSILGFHIHEGASCTGNENDPYADAKAHYNPSQCPHPAHAGDMPPLFSCSGAAWMMYYTERFSLPEILGKTIIIHSQPDDFTTQPSGNSGAKIACGTIVAVH